MLLANKKNYSNQMKKFSTKITILVSYSSVHGHIF